MLYIWFYFSTVGVCFVANYLLFNVLFFIVKNCLYKCIFLGYEKKTFYLCVHKKLI